MGRFFIVVLSIVVLGGIQTVTGCRQSSEENLRERLFRFTREPSPMEINRRTGVQSTFTFVRRASDAIPGKIGRVVIKRDDGFLFMAIVAPPRQFKPGEIVNPWALEFLFSEGGGWTTVVVVD